MTSLVNGFQCHRLSTGKMTLGILPELGGKILSLTDAASGTEWMWAPPDKRGLFRNQPGDVYADGPLTGADECFPTIAPCRWRGRQLADHGDLWTLPWDVLNCTDREVDLQVQPPGSPFLFRRCLTVEGDTVRFAYTLTNTGPGTEDFLWAFHPMLHYDQGDRLEIPASAARIDSQINTPFGERGSVIALPEPMPGVRIDRMDFGPLKSAAVKFFTEKLERGRVALVRPKLNHRLVFEFDHRITDTVGLWLNGGGWAGYRHVIIEPGIGAPDPLDLAAEWNRCGQIKAGATCTWWMTLRLESINQPLAP